MFCLAVILTFTRVVHESLFSPIKIKVAQEASKISNITTVRFFFIRF
ncbi:hypothetical protein LEP1GSC048_2970 [Leptospira santarosai serovar Shermani str. 1342KT]|nr:hypothetical protein LEP1GSC048_2970 [Leptospira santarosai serovar Shermani str. 1342KT]